MKIDTEVLKQLRAEKNWSQEKLSEASGISLRTVQRIESTGNASLDSVCALAEALGVEPSAINLAIGEEQPQTPLNAVRDGFLKFADFSGTATRYEYWWFLAFVVIVLSIAAVIDERLAEIGALIVFVPLLAAGTRRLNDAGQTPWWQMFWFVPFGQIVVLILMAMESESDKGRVLGKQLDVV